MHCGKSIYAIRNKKGQFANIERIHKSIRCDMGKNAKYHPTKPGKGFMGDYLYK